MRQEETRLEQQVSQLIGEMQLLWLDVDDEPGPLSERAYLERNAIGLLSRVGLLSMQPDEHWLGRYSSDWRIAASGLWNLNHVFRRPDADFLERLTIAVERTIGRQLGKTISNVGHKTKSDQLNFFPREGESE